MKRTGRAGSIAFVCAAVACAIFTNFAAAQEFAAPAPAGPAGDASNMIERALTAPPDDSSSSAINAETSVTRWSGLADWTTRAAAVMAAWHAGRMAFGIASTGDGELGWNAAGFAAGVTTPRAGACLSVIGRRDRSPPEPDAPRSRGLEIGAGFWSALGSGVSLWMSAPGMITEGEPPPLDRGLETGLRASSGSLSAWASAVMPSRGDPSMSRALGLACGARDAQLWLEARSAPLRAAAGLTLRRGRVRIAFQADEHPVLGETLHFALSTAEASTP